VLSQWRQRPGELRILASDREITNQTRRFAMEPAQHGLLDSLIRRAEASIIRRTKRDNLIRMANRPIIPQ